MGSKEKDQSKESTDGRKAPISSLSRLPAPRTASAAGAAASTAAPAAALTSASSAAAPAASSPPASPPKSSASVVGGETAAGGASVTPALLRQLITELESKMDSKLEAIAAMKSLPD